MCGVGGALALGSVLALLWALTAAAAGVRLRWLVYIALTSLGFYLHVMFVLLLPVHAVLFALGWPSTRRHWRGALLALASFVLPYLPLVWWQWRLFTSPTFDPGFSPCLLYTSDAADQRSSVDLGGRPIIKKKTPISSNKAA